MATDFYTNTTQELLKRGCEKNKFDDHVWTLSHNSHTARVKISDSSCWGSASRLSLSCGIGPNCSYRARKDGTLNWDRIDAYFKSFKQAADELDQQNKAKHAAQLLARDAAYTALGIPDEERCDLRVAVRSSSLDRGFTLYAPGGKLTISSFLSPSESVELICRIFGLQRKEVLKVDGE